MGEVVEVVIEYRGIAGELAAGDSLIVQSCQAGVLRLRRADAEAARPAEEPKADEDTKLEGGKEGE